MKPEMKSVLTQEHIKSYKENGFVKVENVLNYKEIEELRLYVQEVMDGEQEMSLQLSKPGEDYYKVLNQRVNTWRDHAGMAKFVVHHRLAEIARQLTESQGIRLFTDQVLIKQPNDSKPTPWHQDLPYWPMNEHNALSIWIALDDVDENNGSMMFIPKSHRLGKLDPVNLKKASSQDLIKLAKEQNLEMEDPVNVPLQAGSCTFHNGLTFHYAHANHTDKPRRALVIIYMPDGTTYSGGVHATTDNKGYEIGDQLKGNFFPILASYDD